MSSVCRGTNTRSALRAGDDLFKRTPQHPPVHLGDCILRILLVLEANVEEALEAYQQIPLPIRADEGGAMGSAIAGGRALVRMSRMAGSACILNVECVCWHEVCHHGTGFDLLDPPELIEELRDFVGLAIAAGAADPHLSRINDTWGAVRARYSHLVYFAGRHPKERIERFGFKNFSPQAGPLGCPTPERRQALGGHSGWAARVTLQAAAVADCAGLY
jgi:hypothetical protein